MIAERVHTPRGRTSTIQLSKHVFSPHNGFTWLNKVPEPSSGPPWYFNLCYGNFAHFRPPRHRPPPPVSDGHVSDASSNTPVNTPRFPSHQRTSAPEHLYPILSPVSPTKGQPIPTVLSTQRLHFQQPSTHPQPVVGTLVDLAYNPQQQVYEARYSPQVPTSQPPFQHETDTQLRKRLAKLEHENARLRNENRESINRLHELTEQLQTTINAKFESMDQDFRRRIQELSTNQGTAMSQPGIGTVFIEQGLSGNGPNFNRQYRSFTESEKLSGNRNFREWSSAIMTEFQVLGILETLTSEGATTVQWSPQVRSRADALARSILIQSVTDFIKPQIRDLPSAFQMWSVLLNRYQTASSFEPHKLITRIERLTFAEAGSAIALIEQGIMIRDKHRLISNKLLEEFYWASAILRKLLPFYQLEAQFLMTFPDITLEQIHNYFAERVFDSFEPGKANALYQIAALSDAPPKPNPNNPINTTDTYSRKMYSPRSNNVNTSLLNSRSVAEPTLLRSSIISVSSNSAGSSVAK